MATVDCGECWMSAFRVKIHACFSVHSGICSIHAWAVCNIDQRYFDYLFSMAHESCIRFSLIFGLRGWDLCMGREESAGALKRVLYEGDYIPIWQVCSHTLRIQCLHNVGWDGIVVLGIVLTICQNFCALTFQGIILLRAYSLDPWKRWH